jgi:hypothetical protein
MCERQARGGKRLKTLAVMLAQSVYERCPSLPDTTVPIVWKSAAALQNDVSI